MNNKKLMNENWCEIVDILKPLINPEVSRQSLCYEVESCFRMLGWRKSKGTLIKPYVSSNGATSDIALAYSEGISETIIIPILINPEATRLEIMHNMHCHLGLIIGHDIDVLYRENLSDRLNSIGRIQFNYEDVGGSKLCELLSIGNFNKEALVKFCAFMQELYPSVKLKKIIESLIEDHEIINSCIIQYLLAQGFTKDLISDVFEQIDIIIRRKGKGLSLGVSAPSSEEKESRDKTAFSIDGKTYYNKRKFVLHIIKTYVAEHPHVTIDELEKIFPSRIISKERGVVRPLSVVNHMIAQNPDLKKRYCLKPNEIIRLRNGMEVVVYNQWGTKHFPNFLEIAKSLYTVSSSQQYQFEKKKSASISISTKSLEDFHRKNKQ